MFQVPLHRTPHTHTHALTHTPSGMNLNCSACGDGHDAQIPRTVAQRGDLKRDLLCCAEPAVTCCRAAPSALIYN